jgi:hypothetical protein
MYQFSRSIYRELASDIIAERPCSQARTNHERVLHSCEAAIERLARDRRYFARPARTLFNDVRIFFPMSAQCRVYTVIDRHIRLAQTFFAEQAMHGYDVEGNPLQCRATTRKGKPCQRVPLPQNGYCPSHQHLADTEELAPLAA